MHKIIWTNSALKSFDSHLNYIEQNSILRASDFRKQIHNKLEQVSKYPENYSLDKNKYLNDGTFRYLEYMKVRISFRYFNNTIYVVRFRHTKQAPKNF